MDLLNIRSHFHDGARQAAGTFMSPLTNAIGEQRRLVESLAMVSKVRVEECKHMMTWGKCQTDDLGDVLLKLNLLIRKISDYEICFGTQYELFREKIKFLRTKDDTLCEMGRRQNDLQSKIYDASKSRLRSAKAILLQKELEAVKKEDEPTETKLHQLKRHLIKDAYMGQLDAIIELGKKMQIIGEHGKQLLEHIHVAGGPESADDGEATEDILQEARIALENWSQYAILIPQSGVLHPIPAVSVSGASTESSKTIAVSTGAIEKDLPDAPPLPPRSHSYSSSKSGHTDGEEFVSKKEALRRQEELELKKAMELSLESAKPVVEKFPELRDLNLTEEELRFVMDGDVVPQQLTKKLTIKLPLSAAGSTKIPDVPKVPRAPQMCMPEPEVEDAKVKSKDQEELENRSKDETAVIESMEDTANTSALSRNTTITRSKTRPLESMGAEQETPLESMGTGADAEVALESMGQDGQQGQDNQTVSFVPMPEVPPLEGIRHQKIITNLKKKQQEQLMHLLQMESSTPYPLSPELQYLQVAATPYPNSPELQYLQIANSPQVPLATSNFTPSTLSMAPGANMMPGGAGGHSSSTSGTYQAYKPSTTYVPQATKQRNRQSMTPPPRDGLTPTPSTQQQPLSQNSTSNRYLLQQQRLKFLQEQKQQQQKYQAFYLTPYEQEGSLPSSDLVSKSEHEHAEPLEARGRGKENRYSMPPLSDNYAYKVEL